MKASEFPVLTCSQINPLGNSNTRHNAWCVKPINYFPSILSSKFTLKAAGRQCNVINLPIYFMKGLFCHRENVIITLVLSGK